MGSIRQDMLANAGAHVDFDVVNEDLAKWLAHYIENGGPLDKITISSDTDSTTPDVFWSQLCALVVTHGYTLDFVLPLVTTNPARVLKLERKGGLEVGKDADVLILSRDTVEIRDVVARGRRMVVDGRVVAREKFLSKSSRSIDLVGDKFNGTVGARS